MKKYFLLLAALLMGVLETYSQSVAINNDGSKPNPHAIVDVKSTTKGVLLPRMTTDERHKIPNTRGLLVYDTDDNLYWYNDGTAWQSFFTADLSKKNGEAWLLKGNTKTKVGVDFIGTRDNVPLDFRVNNQPAGRIDSGRNNTYWGYQAGNADSIGENTAKIQMAKEYRIMAVGYRACTPNMFGGNTAVGSLALMANTLGKENAALGYDALGVNTLGFDNAAVGFAALGSNTTGSFNVAEGYFALVSNTIGSTNTAVGNDAMAGNTTGSYNTSIGLNTLGSNGTGSGLTAIGANADVAIDGLVNVVAIGSDVTVDASNKVRIGNSGITIIEGQVPFTTPSDGRFKFNIQENVKGLDFILKLRPVTYQFDVKKQEDFTKGKIRPEQLGTYITSAGNDEATQMIRTGFIAQEVEQAAEKAGYDFDGVKAPQTEKQYYSLSYSSFVVPLVKAVQEQEEIIQVQNKRISDLEQLINHEDDKKIEEQNIRIKNLEQELAEINKSLKILH